MNFFLNYCAWTPNPAVSRTYSMKPREAGNLERRAKWERRMR